MTASFVTEHRAELVALATVIAAFVLAEIVDRALMRHARTLGERVAGRELSPIADTRLRLVRRLIFTTILVLGFALALAQFPEIRKVAAGVLASSALLGLVLGFAARQTLANGIAGISLAIAQPIRIGDLVTFEDETGEVEDIRLAYTSIRCGDGRRLIVPNEMLAQSTIVNHTVVDPRVQVEVDVWLWPEADVEAALAAIGDDDVDVRVAEIDREGIRLAVTSWAESPDVRERVAAELRRESLRRLRAQSPS